MAPTATPEDLRADFLHVNAVDYHPGLDQIALSVPALGEVWILDHSTTTAEAAGSRGGRAGRGGDLLYRWGNPAAYGRGEGSARNASSSSTTCAGSAKASSAPATSPSSTTGATGRGARSRRWTRSAPPLVAGRPLRPGREAVRAGRARLETALPADRLLAPFISGAERLANGNTLVCAGADGILLEVNAAGEVVWEYRNPYTGDVRLADGSFPNARSARSPIAVFRATRIPPDHPALAGRTLAPLDPQPAWFEWKPEPEQP